MKIPAALRPKWRELPGMAVATINAYLLDASPRMRRLLRLPGFAFGALVVLPWLTAAHITAVLAAIGDGRSGALVITDTRSLRARGAWIGCLVGAAFTVLIAFLAASAVLRLDAPAIVVYGVLLVIIAFVSTPLVVLIHPQRTEDRVHASTTAPVDRTRPPSGQAIVTPTLLAAWPRRAGNGSSLINQLTDLADEEELGILLHARTEAVADYYQEFGFAPTGGRRREMLRLPAAQP